MEPVVRIENLRVEYRPTGREQTAKLAVDGLNLAVEAGEVFGFLGPNGAGKTTTMNVLLGFLRPTSGRAYVFGVSTEERIARQRIGYLPELTYYYKFLFADELLRFYGRIFGMSSAVLSGRFDAVLKLVELQQLETPTRTTEERNNVGLAQALINNDLLIFTSRHGPTHRTGEGAPNYPAASGRGENGSFRRTNFGEWRRSATVRPSCTKAVKEQGRASDLIAQHQMNLGRFSLRSSAARRAVSDFSAFPSRRV
jgi:ABC-2 type transport system ATP-binding protein